MPDFDPKSIPILDDIIESDNAGAVEVSDEDIVTEKKADEDQVTENKDDDTFDIFDEETAAVEVEAEVVESALINYQLEEDKGNDVAQSDTTQDVDYSSDMQSSPTTSDIPADTGLPVDLESIVDDVLEELMPNLEQQLRFLIHQALEEKLGNTKS